MLKLCAVVAVFVMAASAQANLLVNGDFNSGVGTPPVAWSYDKAAWSTPLTDMGPLVTGNPSTGVWNAGSNFNPPTAAQKSYGGFLNGSFWIYQSFPTVPGKMYTVTGFYSGGVGDLQPFNGSAWWEIGVVNGPYIKSSVDNPAPSSIMAKTEIKFKDAGFLWKAVNAQFTATTTSAVLYLKYGVLTPNSQYNYFGANFDDISVVPEPSAFLSLLGLALPILFLQKPNRK